MDHGVSGPVSVLAALEFPSLAGQDPASDPVLILLLSLEEESAWEGILTLLAVVVEIVSIEKA